MSFGERPGTAERALERLRAHPLAKHPLVLAVLNRFPGAEIVDIRSEKIDRFDEASDHAYECNCDLCKEWWRRMPPA